MQLPIFPKRGDDEKIGPLIDVVFLLLLFFMLASSLAPPEPIKVNPPDSVDAALAASGKGVVLLAADGRLAFAGQVVDHRTLRQVLIERLSSDKDLLIELKADAAVETGAVLAVMNVLREAGVNNLLLLTATAKQR